MTTGRINQVDIVQPQAEHASSHALHPHAIITQLQIHPLEAKCCHMARFSIKHVHKARSWSIGTAMEQFLLPAASPTHSFLIVTRIQIVTNLPTIQNNMELEECDNIVPSRSIPAQLRAGGAALPPTRPTVNIHTTADGKNIFLNDG